MSGAIDEARARCDISSCGPSELSLQPAACQRAGANAGILSTAGLVLGVASSGASGVAIISAGLAAGALSMAAGEYVSVSSQRDAEQDDIELEARELRSDPPGELRELGGICEKRGSMAVLARDVALGHARRGALEAHARDELRTTAGLGIVPTYAVPDAFPSP